MGKINNLKCAVCGNDIISFRYKSMPQWNIFGELCGECYRIKLTDYYISMDRRDITKNK